MDVDVAGKNFPDIIDGIKVAFKALKDDVKNLQTNNHDLALDLKVRSLTRKHGRTDRVTNYIAMFCFICVIQNVTLYTQM